MDQAADATEVSRDFPNADDAATEVSRDVPGMEQAQDPSIFLLSLHILEWTVLVVGFVMMMVVFMLNW